MSKSSVGNTIEDKITFLIANIRSAEDYNEVLAFARKKRKVRFFNATFNSTR